MEDLFHRALMSRADLIIYKLKALASIRAGDKWSTSAIAPHKPGVIQSISRTFWQENKEMNLADIEGTLTSAIGLARDCKHYEMLTMRDVVKVSIEQALTGISNLKVAYHDHEGVQFRIDNIVKNIKAFLIEL